MAVQLRYKLTELDARLNPFNRRKVAHFAHRWPQAYLGVVILAALCGYLFLMVWPVLALSIPFALWQALASVSAPADLFGVAVPLLLLLLASVISHALLRQRLSPPSGLELSREAFPRLHELLQELVEVYGKPRIDRVVLRDRFEVRVVKTPRNGFPLWSTHTLVIGLPVLLTLSPLDVHVLLARRVGQLGGQHSRLNSWLCFLMDLWPQYATASLLQPAAVDKLVRGFFCRYAPLYRLLCTPLARASELDADVYALQAMNDEDTARAITAQALTDSYLKSAFWPRTIESARSAQPAAPPHARMAKLFAGGLPVDQVQRTLDRLERKEEQPDSAMPSLAERLDNIGHRQPSLPGVLSITAARFYLGSACDSCIEIIDRYTMKKLRSRLIREPSGES